MQKKIFEFLVCLILFQLIIEVKSQAPFKPLKRRAHTATFIDDKLYILGGINLLDTNNEITGQGFFYLDVSKPFTTKDIKWLI